MADAASASGRCCDEARHVTGADRDCRATSPTRRGECAGHAADSLVSCRRAVASTASIRRCGGWRRCIATGRASAAASRPAQDAVRLAQEPSVEFAPATLAGWEPASRTAPPARLLVHFFGLFGPDGALPLHLTEYARDRRRNHRDPTFQRFADIFHHRALSLFYRAWANSRPTVSFDRPEEDRFALYVGALIGLGMDSLRDRDAMPDLTKLHFAGHLACQTRHAEGLGVHPRRLLPHAGADRMLHRRLAGAAPGGPHAAGDCAGDRGRWARPPCWAGGSGAGSTSSAS